MRKASGLARTELEALKESGVVVELSICGRK